MMFWSAKYKSLRMLKKILKLNTLGKYEAAIKIADKLYSQYIHSENQLERTHARLVLVTKALSLDALGRYRELMVHADNAIKVFIESKLSEGIESDPDSDFYIKDMVRNKIEALHNLEEYDKALLLIDSVVDDYITHTHEGIEYITSRILLIKGNIFKLKNYNVDDRLAVFNRVVSRYRKSKSFYILEHVLHALAEIMIVCVERDDYETALTISQIAKELDSRANQVKVQSILTGMEQFEALLAENKKELTS